VETQDAHHSPIFTYATIADSSLNLPFKFEQQLTDAPSLPREPDRKKTHSESFDKISESQDLAAAMIDHHRQQEINRRHKMQEAQTQAKEQTQPANDNQLQRYYNPATGQEMTKEAYAKMQQFLERANQRERERKAKGRDGYDY